MKAILAAKKPIPITVVAFENDVPGLPEFVRVEMEQLVGTNLVQFKVWNELHKSFIGFKIGDYLNVTDANDVYPIDRDYFDKHYEVLS